MDIKVFLQGFDSKKSVNTSEGLNMSLKGKRRLLPTNDVEKVISQYDQYSEEREGCNIIRLTCQVNPICSNVLFNRVSEIVKDEGSNDVTILNYGKLGTKYGENVSENIVYKVHTIDYWSGNTLNYQSVDERISNLSKSVTISNLRNDSYNTLNVNGTLTNAGINHPTNAIRDMQLSNDNYVYHCGLDILNNHLIRSNTFKTICKLHSVECAEAHNYTGKYGAFNTIADLMRDVNGFKVVEKVPFPETANVPENAKFVTMHVYEYDDILPFGESVKQRLVKGFDGWVGFENRPKIKSYEVPSVEYTASTREVEMKIERPIMYMNGGDFVDMYPDRKLYSFVPIYNDYRNRFEKNWNYCLTYPSSSTTEGFEDIIETNDKINSLKALYFNENTRADNGTKQLVIYSIAKHGLSVGDYVNIYNTYQTTLYWVEKTVDGVNLRASIEFESQSEANDEMARLKVKDPNGTYSLRHKDNQTVTHKILDNAEVSEIADNYIFTVFNADVQISKEWVELTESEHQENTLTINGVAYNVDLKTRKFYYKGNNLDQKYYVITNQDSDDALSTRNYVNFDDQAQHLSYKKVVNDIECEYYVRIFSKIPNFKNASADTSSEYEIYKNDAELIHTYQAQEYDFESHASRLAFAKNIYTDEVGEVVFTDDIDISNLKDNLGRPLSSIYFTIVKNNDGYKEWYGFDNTSWTTSSVDSERVEYSHCFGKITCGIETCDESKVDDSINTIYKVNNDTFPMGYDVNSINGVRNYGVDTISVSDNEVYFDGDRHYYGDLSYYDNYNAVERHIQPIMQRFNTAQRESSRAASNSYFNMFIYDNITNDDYDKGDKYIVESYVFGNCNDNIEGYYYNPHYEIPIKTFDKLQTIMPDFLTMRSLVNTEAGAKISVLQNHYLSIGDKSMIYDMANDKYYYCTTVKGDDDTNRVFTCKIYDEDGNEVLFNDLYNSYNIDVDDPEYDASRDISNFKLFKTDNLDIPSYARILKDGTCRFIWRNILNNGFNLSDDTVEEYPFTNGAFYVNRRIDLYLRRQDPHDYWGLYSDADIEGTSVDIEKIDNYVKDTEIVC